MPSYIKSSAFRFKGTLSRVPAKSSLSQSLEKGNLETVGSVWFATPETIDFYRYNPIAEDESKTIVYCKYLSGQITKETINRFIIDFGDRDDFLKGKHAIQRLERMGMAYLKLYLKQA